MALISQCVTELACAGAGSQQLYHPLGLWVAPDETVLHVADSLNFRVQRHEIGGSNPSVSTVVSALKGQPMDVDVDASGSLWVSDSLSMRCVDTATQQQTAQLQGHLESETNAVTTGTVSMYKNKAGWGFIVDQQNVKYFAHHSDILASEVQSGYPQLTKGEQVQFEIRKDSKWKVRATAITGADGRPVKFTGP